MDAYKKDRRFLKSSVWKDAHHFVSDQKKGLAEPDKQKPITSSTEFIELKNPTFFKIGQTPVKETIEKRQSHRKFTNTPLTLNELSYLLWATQGVRQEGPRQLRTVPSAGARHPFETYLYIQNVENLMEGFYRYLPFEHKLAYVFERRDAALRLNDACLNQKFVGNAPVVFIWTAIPYRTEWRYHETSYKAIALDAGHMCQNLYIAAESINAGTCAIAAYDQDKMDILMGVDGEEEFVIYLAPVGKV